ncbi:MAG: HlyD family type I secretion periplasmic adaptor subunit [Aliarcobacter sp.]|jgi:HlyD family secretion protein/adhesin transport system membrane fusion protein|uniref:HlyD family type I secretion periplasmic adaptor subunit n=1 Tax=Aliarcobacter cryaerophilus TaxID=28198 RepID=UPI001B68D2E0|nr:HlyD family type I secretion periplasmic adaptor subunit [Aliarcobacter sp.]MBP7251034.1 HlyD family type I secretion periplasmic adaptor subunit [Aliarcobacter sp.]
MNNRLFEEKDWNYYTTVIPIMLFFIIFLSWAAFSQIDETIKGTGKVVPSGQTKVIQNLEGGIVSAILVNEGDNVKKGDTIYNLSNAFFSADSITKEIDLLTFQAILIRLDALIENKTVVDFPEELKQKIPEIVENETKIFYEDLENNQRKIEIARDQFNQKDYKLRETKIRFNNLSIELNLAMENMKILDELLNKKVASRKEYIAELSKKQSIVTQIEETRNSIPILQEELEEARKKIASAESENKSKLLSKYTEVKTEINKLVEKNKANADREQRKSVISPVNGIINKLYFYTEGGIVKPGDKLAEITPIEDNLTIEAKIKSSDRAFIWEGQDVSIEITAYDFSRYGLLNGKLISISPDSFEDKNGSIYYIAKINADVNSFGEELPILPGMVANVNILTGKKTVLEYILKPLKDIRKNALSEN